MIDKEFLNSLTILYVEDDESLREYTGNFLKSFTKEVIPAVNGADGYDKFLENKDRLSLVLTDLTMPVLDGMSMSKKIREIDSEISIVVTTAHNEPEFIAKAKSIGIGYYTTKPVDISTLITTLINAGKKIEPNI